MRWTVSNRAAPRALRLADRHYSRQQPGTPQFVKPGRCLVLVTEPGDALWVTSWPYPHLVAHAWPDAWECSYFRNEGPVRSSDLIREAVAATRAAFGAPHDFITFVDASKVRSALPGYCYIRAGWKRLRERTKGGHVVLRLAAHRLPPPTPAIGFQAALWSA